MKKILLTALIIWGVIMLANKIHENKKAEDALKFYESQSHKTGINSNEQVNNIYTNYTGHTCAECGSKCISGKEMYSEGDEISYHQPYYLCGSSVCINNRYEKDLKLQRAGASSSSYNDNTRYSAGSDGRVHDAAPCVGCAGTGVESNYDDRGEIRETTCHFCNGIGHLSY